MDKIEDFGNVFLKLELSSIFSGFEFLRHHNHQRISISNRLSVVDIHTYTL